MTCENQQCMACDCTDLNEPRLVTTMSFEVAEISDVTHYGKFVAALNENFFTGELNTDPTGETVPSVTFSVTAPLQPEFWQVLLDEVVNGAEDLFINCTIEFSKVTFGDEPELIHSVTMEDLGILLVSPVSTESTNIQFVLFDAATEYEEE